MYEIAFAAHTDIFGCFPSATCRRIFAKNGYQYLPPLPGLARKSIRMVRSIENLSITRYPEFATAQAEKSLSESGRWLGNLLDMESREGKRNVFLTGINRLTAGLLLFAPASWPYSYYIFLRWFVFLSMLLHIGASISRHRLLALVVFVSIGLLFNPIEPIYLSKGVWVFIDLFAAMFVVIGHEELNND
jgi:hypothetical protein